MKKLCFLLMVAALVTFALIGCPQSSVNTTTTPPPRTSGTVMIIITEDSATTITTVTVYCDDVAQGDLVAQQGKNGTMTVTGVPFGLHVWRCYGEAYNWKAGSSSGVSFYQNVESSVEFPDATLYWPL